jgi:hypothetical protein
MINQNPYTTTSAGDAETQVRADPLHGVRAAVATTGGERGQAEREDPDDHGGGSDSDSKRPPIRLFCLIRGLSVVAGQDLNL